MKIQSLILSALMGLSITPLHGSESAPKTDPSLRLSGPSSSGGQGEESKKRRALESASSEAIVKLKSDVKSKTADEQLKDAVAILTKLLPKDVDKEFSGGGEGLPSDLQDIVMDLAQDIEDKKLYETRLSGLMYELLTDYTSDGKPITILGKTDGFSIHNTQSKFVNSFGCEDAQLYCVNLFRDHKNTLLVKAAFENGTLCTWNLEDRELLAEEQLPEKRCFSLASDSDGTLLAATESYVDGDDKDKTIIKIWNLTNNTCIQQFPEGHSTAYVLTQDSDNEMVLVMGKSDGKIEIWDVKKGTLKSVLPGHTEKGGLYSAEYYQSQGLSGIEKLDPDETYLVRRLAVCKNKNNHLLIASTAEEESTAEVDKLVYVWNASTGKCVLLHNAFEPTQVVKLECDDCGNPVVYIEKNGSVLNDVRHGLIQTKDIHTIRFVPGVFEKACKEQADLEKATEIIQEKRDAFGWKGLPPELQRIVYDYAKPE